MPAVHETTLYGSRTAEKPASVD